MKTSPRCPYTGIACPRVTDGLPHEVLSSSVGGKGVFELHLGHMARLADFHNATPCDVMEKPVLPEVGQYVPVTRRGEVAVVVGPTATTSCLELHPWGKVA